MTKIAKTLLIFIAVGVGSASHAIPIHRIYGETPEPQFLQQYFERLYKWHSENGLHLENQFTSHEKQFFSLWKKTLSTWGVPFDKNHIFNHFYFEHAIVDGKVQPSSLFIGARDWPKEAETLIGQITTQHGHTMSQEMRPFFFGIHWASSGAFEVHYLFTAVTHPAMPPQFLKISKDYANTEWNIPRLFIFVYDSKKKLIDEKVIVASKVLDWSQMNGASLDALSAQKIISVQNGTQWKMDLRSISHNLLNPEMRPAVNGLSKNFRLYPKSLMYQDVNNYSLFYP